MKAGHGNSLAPQHNCSRPNFPHLAGEPIVAQFRLACRGPKSHESLPGSEPAGAPWPTPETGGKPEPQSTEPGALSGCPPGRDFLPGEWNRTLQNGPGRSSTSRHTRYG